MAISFRCNPTDSVRVTSSFGTRNLFGMEYHNGIDIGPMIPGKVGDNIYSIADGIVKVSKIDPTGYGNYIVIDHGAWCSLYAHLQSLEVKVGQRVKTAEIIGHMGNTGISTGAHLHFETRDCDYSKFWERDSGKYIHTVDPQVHILKDVLPLGESLKTLQTKCGFDNNTIAWYLTHPWPQHNLSKLVKNLK